MQPYRSFKVAAVQAGPVYMDVDASLEKACRLIGDAADTGAVVASFSETWLPGYPFFLFSPPDETWWRAAARYVNASITIPGPETDVLCDAAKKAGIDVVIGVVEREASTRGSVYATLLFIGHEGVILGRHRKTRPTLHERAIWSDGDGTGLQVYERHYARISGLCCWEHNTVLPGYALMAQGTELHFAVWPGMHTDPPPAPMSLYSRQLLLSRAFASQGAAYVVCVGGLRSAEHVPPEFKDLHTLDTSGGSCIIDPRGEVLVGPVLGEQIIVAECSNEHILAAKVGCDVGGHYSRPDLFKVWVNREPPSRVSFSRSLEQAAPVWANSREEASAAEGGPP